VVNEVEIENPRQMQHRGMKGVHVQPILRRPLAEVGPSGERLAWDCTMGHREVGFAYSLRLT